WLLLEICQEARQKKLSFIGKVRRFLSRNFQERKSLFLASTRKEEKRFQDLRVPGNRSCKIVIDADVVIGIVLFRLDLQNLLEVILSFGGVAASRKIAAAQTLQPGFQAVRVSEVKEGLDIVLIAFEEEFTLVDGLLKIKIKFLVEFGRF